MPLPVTAVLAADAYANLRGQATQMINLGQQLRAQIDAGVIYSAFLLDVLNTSVRTLSVTAEMRTVPGLVNFATLTIGDPELDVTQLLNDAAMALYELQLAIISEYPIDQEGHLLDRVFQSDGQVQWLTIPASSLIQTSEKLNSFLSTLT